MSQRSKHPYVPVGHFDEVGLAEAALADETKYVTLGLGAQRLQQIQSQGVPARIVGVREAQSWIDPHGQGGQPAFHLSQAVAVVEDRVERPIRSLVGASRPQV